jgi:hypothetical protein
MLTDVAAAVRHLEGRMEQRFTALEEKFDRKLDETFGTIDRRIDRLEAGFLWMIGIQFATLIAVVGAAIVG